MSTTRAITLKYELKPPASTIPPEDLSLAAEHTFPVAPRGGRDSAYDVDTKSYYTALRASVAEARAKAGVELSAWKDVVGNAELGKEGSTRAADEDEDEGEV
ncbi:hypothetical protein BV22DRAFT_1132682 [Leucogyrophana mollusca]|uniref:Uncharacterized protein n=1 Tax=Leucogyrophana mollusca TaxID=85980 RepID=A0ACB8B7S7_9AGAM|nr:hypothetical protein BV22DRAFT_1132682 [Leucogyrophana mollusca]